MNLESKIASRLIQMKVGSNACKLNDAPLNGKVRFLMHGLVIHILAKVKELDPN